MQQVPTAIYEINAIRNSCQITSYSLNNTIRGVPIAGRYRPPGINSIVYRDGFGALGSLSTVKAMSDDRTVGLKICVGRGR